MYQTGLSGLLSPKINHAQKEKQTKVYLAERIPDFSSENEGTCST